MKKRATFAQPPVELTGLKLASPKKMAAGFTAVRFSLEHLKREMGLARGIGILNQLNQHKGTDCPGCAWPDPKERSSLGEYCENGAKAIAEEATEKRIGADFFAKHSVEELSMKSDFWIGKRGRITEPLILEAGSSYYKPISYDDAFTEIANELKKLDNPDEAIFYTSGRTSNEAAFLYQLMVRQYGTNNLPDCSNMCHESSGVALSETLGIGKGSVKLEDFYESELILIFGQNPGTNHPRMLSALLKAKENGAKIVSINPIKEAGLLGFKDPQKVGHSLFGSHLSDVYLQVKINEDVALLKALMLGLLEEEEKAEGEVLDLNFIQSKTSGFDSFKEELLSHDISLLLDQADISKSDYRKCLRLLQYSKKIIACWAMGITQHRNGVDNIREIVNLLLMKGSIGIPGGGTCPVRGHSNVQGDRTMGIWEKPPAVFLDKLDSVFGIKSPREDGFHVVSAIEEMQHNKGRVFFAMGGNFLSAAPDTELTAAALRNCKLTVQVSTKLNRSHLVTGERAIILPCLGRTDKDKQKGGLQFVSVENSMGVVHSSRGSMDPPAEGVKSEPAIVAGLATALFGKNSPVSYLEMVADYDRIREKIEAVIPGFENYNERVRETGGFYLPNNARIADFSKIGGRAKFTVNELPDEYLEDDQLFMMTIRSHDQFNTTIYGLDDRYRGIKNERRVILMNRKDIKQWKLREGDLVDLINEADEIERIAKSFIVVKYDIPQSCCATYFPEANAVVPLSNVARKSHTPVSKKVIIRLRNSATVK